MVDSFPDTHAAGPGNLVCLEDHSSSLGFLPFPGSALCTERLSPVAAHLPSGLRLQEAGAWESRSG